MKRIFSVLFALAVVVTTTSTVYAQCSNATLTGNYPFIYSGSNAPGHSVTGKNTFGNAAVGVLTFDGIGGLPRSPLPSSSTATQPARACLTRAPTP